MTFYLSRNSTVKSVIAAIVFCTATSFSQAQVRILFDATKGQMAGNADWVIDYDATTLGVGSSGTYLTSSGHQSNPQQIPTPPQSGIITSTTETYWSGGLSAWGVDCAKKGYTVETLPWNGQITYGNTTNPQDLSHYQVFVVDEPNLVFSAAEKTAIVNYVKFGGSLFFIADHDVSDRNGDGWDSPHIWNDLFTTNSVVANPFGINFDYVDFSQTTTNISSTTSDSIIHGPMGNVAKAQWAGGTTMTLDPTKNPTVKGVVFKTGTTPGNTNAMVAYGRYGSGKFAAMGDSSPADDGTGNPTCTLYNGYFADASGNHQLLIMNITIWLATKAGSLSTSLNADESQPVTITVFPNPAEGTQYISPDRDLTNVTISICTTNGAEVLHKQMNQLNRNEQLPLTLSPGYYFLKVVSDQTVHSSMVSFR